MADPARPVRIAYDCTLHRPGCPILQAALGGEPMVADVFPVQSWLLAPTPDMHLYEATATQLLELVMMAEQARVTSAGEQRRNRYRLRHD